VLTQALHPLPAKCHHKQGLIKLHTATTRVEVLANRVSPSSPLQPGSPINYANDLDVGPDGTVYFTDSVDVSPHRSG
jgi:sugar lactone lactonase YvrE